MRRLRKQLQLAGAVALCVGLVGPVSDAGAAEPRAMELVSPIGGASAIRQSDGGVRASTPDGNHVCFSSPDPLVAGQEPLGGARQDDAYCAHRSATGWATEWISRPRGRVALSNTGLTGATIRFVTDDGARTVFSSDIMIDPAVPEPPTHAIQVRDSYLGGGGDARWLTGPRAPGDTSSRYPLAASSDLNHVVFDGPAGVLHEWTPAGTRVVSRDAQGQAVAGSVQLEGSRYTNNPDLAVAGSISRDGSRIFFEATGDLVPDPDDDHGQTSVYVRENGTTTRLVSPRRGGQPTHQPIRFHGASDDGDVIYISSLEQLTTEPIVDRGLYRYRLSTDQLDLIDDDLTGGGSGNGAVIGVSADGSTVFYVVQPSTDYHLYVGRSGTTTLVTSLASTDISPPTGEDHRVADSRHNKRAFRTTRDGSVAVFRAQADQATPAVYRWSATDGLEVISRDANGTRVDGVIGNIGHLNSTAGQHNSGRVMSTDGATVFFTSAAPLVAGDTNGRADLYQWHAGEIDRITSGTWTDDAWYVDNSEDGTTVFFATTERVLPLSDVNSVMDLYAARVGGGFPQPAPSPIGSPATGAGPAGPSTDASPPSTTAAPVTVPPASPPAPAGDEDEPRAVSVRVGSAALRRNGRSIRIRLSVSQPGRLVAEVEDRRGDVIARARRSVTRSGSAAVTVRLSKRTARRVARGKRPRVRVVATFTPRSGEPVETTKRLRLKSRGKHRGRVAGKHGERR